MNLEKTWRWFGEKDNISLSEIQQIGIEGIVTALHHIPNGEVWPVEDIKKTQKKIEQHGLRWTVVESLPVHESIKFAGNNRDILLGNYKESLKNLAACNIKTICYNFMPVIDWIRTELNHKLPNGKEVLYFNFVDFVVFDLCILDRDAATNEYPLEIVEKAKVRFKKMSQEDIANLIDIIIVKTQGFIDGITAENPEQAIGIFKTLLNQYAHIDDDKLRENLKYFLEAIIPTAEEYGIKMCIHPDDPPIKVLGLPRIVSCKADIEWILNTVSSPSNGLTFCTGSLGASSHNDLDAMVKEFASRIYFAHLRSTQQEHNGNFYEAEHLEGSVNMYNIIKSLVLEVNKRNGKRIPMRVDHGRKILSDFNNDYNPGYPLLGRMKAMAEITGMTMAIEKNLK